MISLQKIIKTWIDILVAAILLIILSPIYISISILIYIIEGRPILFSQPRPGLNEKIFNIFKFRTMSIDTQNILSDHERTTRLGNFLRKTSLDEIPQLLNVLRGELSLVGPRPLLVEYLPLYNDEQKKRHTVKPGITGWAQINGRNSISWKQKFELDLWYIEHWSLWLDFKILFLTAHKVFKKDQINASKYVTMEKFKGNN